MSIRPDGFVRLDDVRNYGPFRQLLPLAFDELLQRADESKRFKIVYDHDIRIGANAWWIRARTGHTIKGVDMTVQRILSSPKKLPLVVHPVDLELWMHARRHGIPPRPSDRLIQLRPTTKTENLSYAAGQVCIFFDIAQMLSAGIQLFRTTRGAVLTTGDTDNVLPPRLFLQVVKVDVDRHTMLLTPSENVEESELCCVLQPTLSDGQINRCQWFSVKDINRWLSDGKVNRWFSDEKISLPGLYALL
ncbi:hypothetical protein B0H13DRAFT_2667677 [Mycena leptocephala]|nr:hypothetical protein B0H13DRAFT_2667677 [Mycena leptocephala]